MQMAEGIHHAMGRVHGPQSRCRGFISVGPGLLLLLLRRPLLLA
jgi:hypothetical protein